MKYYIDKKGDAPTSTTSKIYPLYFWQYFFYPLSKLHLYRKHSFIVIFTPMKCNAAVKLTTFMTKIHLFLYKSYLLLTLDCLQLQQSLLSSIPESRDLKEYFRWHSSLQINFGQVKKHFR